MTEIKVVDQTLVLEPQGWSRIWTFKRTLIIPLAHIKNARHEAVDIGWGMKGWRILGTFVPSICAGGTFYNKGYEFWDVRNPQNVIVIDLENDGWKRLIVEVADPASSIAAIQRALPVANSTSGR